MPTFSSQRIDAHPYLNALSTERNATTSVIISFDALNRAASKSALVLTEPLLRVQTGSRILACSSHFLATTAEASSASGKKRSRRPVAQSFGSECGGCVFGVSLADLLLYSTINKVSVASLTRMLHSALVPVASAALATRGADAEGLCRGIAAHRTCKSQVMRQTPSPLRLHPKHGSPNTVIGLCCAIYAIFSIFSNETIHETRQSFINDIAWLVERRALLAVLAQAETRTEGYLPRGFRFGSPQVEDEAFNLELRAIQRAKVGVRTAMAICGTQSLGAVDSLRLQLAYYRVAAWPREEMLGKENHDQLLEKLTNALFFASQQETPSVYTFGSGFVVPLSELAGVARDERCARDDASSFGSVSSFAALSATSSNCDFDDSDPVVFDASKAFESCKVRML